MIPKKIHYIWLGKNKKSKLTELCINTRRRKLPDYEIIEWNEENVHLHEICKNNKFIAKCIQLKLWAFVSDYIRVKILYEHGGIYLDTDVEVLKSFDLLLQNQCFLGLEEDEYICTAVIGSEKGNPFIKRILDFYDSDIWDVNFINNPIIFKHVLNESDELRKSISVYPIDYFSPYSMKQNGNKTVETVNTFAVHWFTANWNMSRKGFVFINTKHIKNPIKKMFVSFKKSFGYLLRKVH